jgi:hypothetical protein
MKKKRITEKIKLDIYKKVLSNFLDRYKDSNFGVGFCYVFHIICLIDYEYLDIDAYRDLFLYKIKIFKELQNFRPTSYKSGNWYPYNKKGYIKRITILKTIIKNLEKDINKPKNLKMQQRIINSKTTNNSKVRKGNKINYVPNIAIVQYDHNWIDKNGELRLGARFEEIYLKNLPKNDKGVRYAKDGRIVGVKYKKVRECSKEEQLINILQDDLSNKSIALAKQTLINKVNAGKLPKSMLIETTTFKLCNYE